MGKNGNQKNVLVAMDGSRPSQIAATLATQIAAYRQLEIKGLYVVNAYYVLNRYADVLVINRYRHNTLSDWFKGSPLDRLLQNTHVTTLVA